MSGTALRTTVPANESENDMTAQTLHVTRWGDSGPRVVLVHGSAQGGALGGERHFVAQQRLAQMGWQVIVPDRPGHGKTPSPGRPDEAQADAALVAPLLGDSAHLVGHSFGGCVALAAAAMRPEAVRTLTLIEPAMMLLAMDDPVVRRFGLRMLRILFLSFSPTARIRRFCELVNIPAEIRGASDVQEQRQMGKAIRRLKLPSKAEVQAQLQAVKAAGIPLLVVTGGWSPAFEATSDRVASVGGGRRVVIPSPHHFPQQISEEFNDTLAAFMREREERS